MKDVIKQESSILAARMKFKGKYFALMGLSLCIILQSGCTGGATAEETVSGRSKNLASATEFINERCPEMVDPETSLDSVILSYEGGLDFYYTLPNKVKSGINPEAFTAFMLPSIIRNVQSNPDLRMHRDSSVMINFNYRDRNGELITEFSVSPEMYR